MTSHPSPGVRRRDPLPARTLGLVACGAAAGAVARYAATTAWPAYGVLAVNVVGAFVLGLATARWAGRRPGVLALVGSGFCGGFTTFSTALVEVVRAGDPAYAWGMLALDLVAAVVAVVAGLALGRRRGDR